MALSEKFRRLARLVEPDVQRMVDRHAQRVAGYDNARFDDRTGIVSYQHQGALIWQPRAEKIGEWSDDLALFRWYWYGVRWGEGPQRRLDIVHREGESYGLVELVTDTVQVDSDAEAVAIAELAAQLARADGVLRVKQANRVLFFALFDGKPSDAPRAEGGRSTPPSQRPDWMTNDPHEQPTRDPRHFTPAPIGSAKTFSVKPPPRHDSSVSMRPGGSRTLAPARPVEVSADDGFDAIPAAPPPLPRIPMPGAPRLPVREPARDIFMPVAQVALGEVASSLPGFGQAILVLRVESSQGKGRFFVQLVALDSEGDLIALDPSRGLLDAAAKMIADDAREGNGRWSKLAARLRPTERGAKVDIDVA